MKVIIYTLADPIAGDIRYVGMTTASLSERLHNHIKSVKYRKRPSKNGKQRWIEQLIKQGLKPIIEEIETVEGNVHEIEYTVESYWIWQFKVWGFDLLNIQVLHTDYTKLPKFNRYKTAVNRYDLNGNFIDRFESMAEAGLAVNGQSSLIQRAAKKKNGWKAYGYQWRYDEDMVDNIGPALSIYIPNEERKVVQLKNGVVVKVWKSGQEAAETLKLLKSKISNCCHGKRKSHGGYEWKFYDDK